VPDVPGLGQARETLSLRLPDVLGLRIAAFIDWRRTDRAVHVTPVMPHECVLGAHWCHTERARRGNPWVAEQRRHTNASPDSAGARAGMLSVKKVLAGRGAVDYYLAQTQRGLADYHLPGPDLTSEHNAAGERLVAPGSAWWGSGAGELELVGEVERAEFVPLYAKVARPSGGYLGRRFRTQQQAAAVRAEALAEAGTIPDPYDRWEAEHEIRRGRGKASVAAWDCTFSPVKSVSLLWASGDRAVQQQVWAAQMAAVDAGLAYLEEHAGYVRAGRNGIRVLESSGLVVARMNEWSSRTGDMQLHTHCLVLNWARTVEDGKWRVLDGRAILAARTGAGAVYNRVLEAELTRRLGISWRDRPDGLRAIDGVDDGLIEAFSTRRRAITTQLAEMLAVYEDTYGVPAPPAVVSAMAQDATLTTRPGKQHLDPVDALAQWETTARARGRKLTDLPARVLGRATPRAATAHGEVAPGRLPDRRIGPGRATFARHDLLRAALDVVEVGASDADELRAAAEALVDATLAGPELLTVTVSDPIAVPEPFRRSDGASSYDRPGRQRWSTP
jgi:conjugative relaxase-like TrwC/TraI family protein